MALVAVVAIIANELESGTETQNSPVDVDLPGRYTTTVTTSATRGLTAGSRVDAREGSTVASDAFAGWTEPEPSSGFPFSNSLSSSDSPDSPASPDPPKTRLARRAASAAAVAFASSAMTRRSGAGTSGASAASARSGSGRFGRIDAMPCRLSG